MVVYIIFPWKLHLVALSLSPLIPLFLLRVVSAASCSASLPQLLKYPSKIFYTNYVPNSPSTLVLLFLPLLTLAFLQNNPHHKAIFYDMPFPLLLYHPHP